MPTEVMSRLGQIGIYEKPHAKNGNRLAHNLEFADVGMPGAVGKARVGRAVPCAPSSDNGRVPVCRGATHGATRPTFASAFWSAVASAARHRSGMEPAAPDRAPRKTKAPSPLRSAGTVHNGWLGSGNRRRFGLKPQIILLPFPAAGHIPGRT